VVIRIIRKRRRKGIDPYLKEWQKVVNGEYGQRVRPTIILWTAF
jgi:hypothetical protein